MQKVTRNIAMLAVLIVTGLSVLSCATSPSITPPGKGWYQSVTWDYSTTATGNSGLTTFGYGSDTDYWYFEVGVDLTSPLPKNGGIAAYVSIDDTNSSATAAPTNTYAQWSLPSVQLPGFTPDYGFAIQADGNGVTVNGLGSLANNQIELMSRSSGSADLTSGGTIGKIYKDDTSKQIDTTQPGAAYDSGIYYVRIPKTAMPASTIKAVTWIWGAGGAWGDGGKVKGAIATLPLQTNPVTNEFTNGTILNAFDTYGNAVSTPVGTISLDKTSYLGVSGDSATITVVDSAADISSNITVSVTAGSITNFDLALVYDATGKDWTNTITLGTNASGADIEATNDYTLSVSYTAQASGVGNISTSASVVSVAPAQTIDGLKDAWWYTAPKLTKGSPLEPNWAYVFDTLYVTNNNSDLFVGMDIGLGQGAGNARQQYMLLIDSDSSSNTGIIGLSGLSNNILDFDPPNTTVFSGLGFDLAVRSWDDTTGYKAFTYTNANTTNGMDVTSSVAGAGTAGLFYEWSVPLSTLGIASGANIKVLVMHFNYWATGFQALSSLPENDNGGFVDQAPNTNSTGYAYQIH